MKRCPICAEIIDDKECEECPICGEELIQEEEIIINKKSKSNIEEITIYKCPYCNKSYSGNSMNCPSCGKKQWIAPKTQHQFNN